MTSRSLTMFLLKTGSAMLVAAMLLPIGVSAQEHCPSIDAAALAAAIVVERRGAIPPIADSALLQVSSCQGLMVSIGVALEGREPSEQDLNLEEVDPLVRARFVAAAIVALAQRQQDERQQDERQQDERQQDERQQDQARASSIEVTPIVPVQPLPDASLQPRTELPADPSESPETTDSESEPGSLISGGSQWPLSLELDLGMTLFLQGPTALPTAHLIMGVAFLRIGVDGGYLVYPHEHGSVETVLWTGRVGVRIWDSQEPGVDSNLGLALDLYGIAGTLWAQGRPGEPPVGPPAESDGSWAAGGSAALTLGVKFGMLNLGARLEAGWLSGIEVVDGPRLDGPYVELSLSVGLGS